MEVIGASAFDSSMDDIWIKAIYFPATTQTENIALDAFDKARTILYCYKDTPMHTYAVNNDYAYVLIDGTEEDNLVTGTDGKCVDWQLDKVTGKLTINTSGDMPDDYRPWFDYRVYVTSLEITGNTTTIGACAFAEFRKLESVELPDAIAFIKNSAFSGCERLGSITLPETLEVIENYAFWECDSLTEIIIPYRVSYLNDQAFSSSLEKIVIRNKYLPFSEDSFFQNKNIKIYGYSDSTAKTFADNKNYTFISLEDHEHEWVEVIRVTGDSSGKRITTCRLCGEVKAKVLSNTDVWLEYTTVQYSNGNEQRPTVLSDTLKENVDFTATYSDNVNVGTAKVTITGIGNYTGTVTKTFTIEPADISEKFVYLSSETYIYDGTEKKPTVTIEGLVENTDFTVEYIDNIDEGTATVIITGIGNYMGEFGLQFTIEAPEMPEMPKIDISEKTASLSSEIYTYDGTEKRPTVIIDGLVENADFTVEYADNIGVGTGKVTIIGIGSYVGQLELQFSIEPANISEKFANLSCVTYTYDGEEKKPIVTIEGLEENTDYVISYANNIHVGTATATITGIGNYVGRFDLQFTIEAAKISDESVSLNCATYTYDGTEKRPTITVTDKNGSKLLEGTDYTVAYLNNVNAGTASVRVTFKGDYAGTVTKTFKISPIAASKVKATLSKTVYTYNGNAQKPSAVAKYANKTLVNGNDYTVGYASGRKNVGKYAVKITYKGNYSGTTILYFKINPKATAIKSLTKASKAFTVKWGKVSQQTTGYQIRYSTSSTMSSAKTVKITSYKTTSKKVTNLKANKKYYVQIRTYKVVNGVTYYSSWSTKKFIKTK